MKELENVDLFNMSADDGSLNVFDKQTTNQDGIYRPKLDEAKDKKTGYRSVFRFLPNFLESGKLGPSAIEKHVHYADLKNEPGLAGYYDCAKNWDPKCPLCTLYWKLKNSNNQADVEKSSLINRTTKYYSYIQIIEDEQNPDLVGKILIFPYGYTVKEKINSERNGEVTGEPCNIFDLSQGKDFVLIIKEKGGYPNYESSQFKDSSPIKLYDSTKNKFIPAPIDDNGKITNAKVQKKIQDFLLERTVDLTEHAPIEWDTEMTGKIENILAVLNGEEFTNAQRMSKNSDVNETVSNKDEDLPDTFGGDDTDTESFFSIDDEE